MFFFSSRRRHTRCALVTGVQTCALPIYRLDGQGRVVAPGMIDAHGHVMATGFAKMTLDLTATKSLDEALSRIAAWAAAHPDAPWILGTGWNQEIGRAHV